MAKSRSWLRVMRKMKGDNLSQEDVARQMDMSTRHYQDIEAGRTFPGRASKLKLAAFYGKQIFDFFANEEKAALAELEAG